MMMQVPIKIRTVIAVRTLINQPRMRNIASFVRSHTAKSAGTKLEFIQRARIYHAENAAKYATGNFSSRIFLAKAKNKSIE